LRGFRGLQVLMKRVSDGYVAVVVSVPLRGFRGLQGEQAHQIG